jgi:hypothetical protein
MKPYISKLHSNPDYSTEYQVRMLLCTNLGLADSRVADMLSLPEVCRTMKAVPKYESHLKFMIMMLTMQIGVERSMLAPLVAEHPTFLLSQAPFLKDNLRELRRALAFHFDIFLKTNSDELPETWRAMLRQRPDLLLVHPERAEAVLRWWATLVKTASLESATATAFVKYILVTSPEILNQKVKLMQYDANKIWWYAKGRRSGGGSGGGVASSKRNLIGEAARARFILAYTAITAGILNNEELQPLQSLEEEIQECLADFAFPLPSPAGDDETAVETTTLVQNNIKIR